MKNKELIVTKHNSLIESYYKLTLDEMRLLTYCIAQIDSRLRYPVTTFDILATDFAHVFNLCPKNVYKQLQEAVSRLANRWICLKEKTSYTQIRWVYEIVYHNDKGFVRLSFSPSILPYLTNLHRCFTSIKLSHFASFKHIHSIRVYELCIQWKKAGMLLITLEEFKKRLGIENEYTRFYDLNQLVIQPALKEIAKYTQIDIAVLFIKINRIVQKLKFTFIKEIKDEKRLSNM